MRQIPLEDRIDAIHVLLSNLVAHLEDAGLVDRQVLENDVLLQLDCLESSNRAVQDVQVVFDMATALRGAWERARSDGRGSVE